MKYIKLAFQYMFNKHFWKLLLFSIVPSILLSLISQFNSTIKLFIRFFDMEYYDFKSLHRNLMDTGSINFEWWYYPAIFLILVILSILLSIMIGTMQRHMRTGKFQITNIFKRINENVIPSFLTLIAIFVFIFIFGVSVSFVTSLWFTITKNNIATFVLSLIFMICAFVFLIVVIALFSMTTPDIVCTGKKIRDAISLSIRTVGSKLVSICFSFALPLLFLFLIQIGISFANIRILQFIADTLMMIFICSYYPVLVFVTYYDLFDRDREDLLPENRL